MNLLEESRKLFEGMFRERLFRATVTGTSGNLVTIQRTGETAPDAQSYPRLNSYAAPAADDEVIVVQIGSGLIVLGKVLR